MRQPAPPAAARLRRSGRSARELLLASHLAPAAAVTTVATAYAGSTGLGRRGAAAVGAAVLAGQLGVGWHNDWLDVARDVAADRHDKPVVRGGISRRAVGVAAALALAADVPLSLRAGRRAGPAHLVAVGSALSYNALLKRGPLSFLPFAASFGTLPSVATLGLAGSPFAPWWASGAGGLLGVGAHLLNALPDLEADRAAGIAGLPHRLGRRRSLAVAAGALLAASALLCAGADLAPFWRFAGIGSAAALTVAIVLSASEPRSRRPFELALILALLDVTLLVLAGRHCPAPSPATARAE